MAEIEHTQTKDTVDTIAADAVGGENLGAGYYRSFRFLGSMLGLSMGICCVYASYLMPVGILTAINADIGMFQIPIFRILANHKTVFRS